MPFSVAIRAVPYTGQASWWIDTVDWWDSGTLRDDPRFRPVSRTQGYRDFAGVLSREEVRVWHREQRPRAAAGVFAGEAWQAALKPKLEALDAALDADDGPEFFVVLVYEWESGL